MKLPTQIPWFVAGAACAVAVMALAGSGQQPADTTPTQLPSVYQFPHIGYVLVVDRNGWTYVVDANGNAKAVMHGGTKGVTLMNLNGAESPPITDEAAAVMRRKEQECGKVAIPVPPMRDKAP